MARMSPDTLNGKRNCHCQFLSCCCTLSLLVSDILLSVLLILPSLCLFLAFLIGSGDVGGGQIHTQFLKPPTCPHLSFPSICLLQCAFMFQILWMICGLSARSCRAVLLRETDLFVEYRESWMNTEVSNTLWRDALVDVVTEICSW